MGPSTSASVFRRLRKEGRSKIQAKDPSKSSANAANTCAQLCAPFNIREPFEPICHFAAQQTPYAVSATYYCCLKTFEPNCCCLSILEIYSTRIVTMRLAAAIIRCRAERKSRSGR